MLNTLSNAALERLLNQFSVPMFALERAAQSADFSITCVNTAMERLCGLSRDDMIGRSIVEMAAATEEVRAHYQRCVSTRETIRFSFLFTREQRRMSWDQTLQFVPGPDGLDRVIATALKPCEEVPHIRDELAFEDLNYYATIADLQLENLSSGFASAAERARVGVVDEDRIMRLHAVCRTIQSTVGDIKSVVRDAQARRATHRKGNPARCQQGSGVALGAVDTVTAIVNAGNDPDG